MRSNNTFGIHFVLRTNRGKNGKAAIYEDNMQIFRKEYKLYLPSKEDLKKQLEDVKTIYLLEPRCGGSRRDDLFILRNM